MAHLRLLLLAAALVAGCRSESSSGLPSRQVEFLAEDVADLMDTVFQTGENAYFGDPVSSADVIEDAGPGNGWTVTYDLPPDVRLGLGPGVGRVRLGVEEDGVPHDEPLLFAFSTSDAFVAEVVYEIEYEGETAGGRATDLALRATLRATRASVAEPFLLEYYVEGGGWFGATWSRVETRFASRGPPHEMLPGFNDGAGEIDDPDVAATFELDIDYRGDGTYFAEGWVGCCAFFRERFVVPR